MSCRPLPHAHPLTSLSARGTLAGQGLHSPFLYALRLLLRCFTFAGHPGRTFLPKPAYKLLPVFEKQKCFQNTVFQSVEVLTGTFPARFQELV